MFQTNPRQAAGADAMVFRRGGATGLLVWLVVTSWLSGCGSALFERAPNAKKYRALPLGTEVKVVGSSGELQQPTEIIGVLHTTTKGDPANRDEAAGTLREHAARYGCDGVAHLTSTRREIKTLRRNRSLGPNGVPIYTDVPVISAEHDWIAQCIRSAAAPAEAAVQVAANTRKPDVDVKPEPKAEPKPVKRPKKPDVQPEPKPEPKLEPRPEPKPEPRIEPKPQMRPEPKPEPRVEPKPEPRVEPKPEPRIEPKPEPRPEPKPKVEPPPVAPALDAGDPKLGAEVARFFLQWSGALERNDIDKICASFDDTVFIDVSASAPKIRIKQEFPVEAACESVRNGDLAAYIRDFGPAEVHSEPKMLIPDLFRIHGGAYLRLDDAAQRRYADAVIKGREGKKQLACTLYNVVPAENLFKVSMTCSGVNSFRVLMKRTGENQFKIMQLQHSRP